MDDDAMLVSENLNLDVPRLLYVFLASPTLPFFFPHSLNAQPLGT